MDDAVPEDRATGISLWLVPEGDAADLLARLDR